MRELLRELQIQIIDTIRLREHAHVSWRTAWSMARMFRRTGWKRVV